jgi:UDP-glucose 4-epimerase
MSGLGHALVTGGAGFIGSHLVRALLDRGLAVTVLDDLSTGVATRLDPRAVLVEGDIRDPEAVESALPGVDCVFHLAARVTIRGSVDRFYDDVDHNLMGTANVLRSIAGHPIRRFVLASSMAVYAPAPTADPLDERFACEPISPYGISKLASERLAGLVLAKQGVDFTALRYFNTYGPHQGFTPYVGVITIFATLLLRGEAPTIFGDGEQRRDFVHVDDIVAGTVAALDGPPGVYNLGTGEATSINDLARIIIDEIRPGTTPSFAPPQEGEPRYSVADIGAAQRHLGYEPQRRLEVDLRPVITAIGDALEDS